MVHARMPCAREGSRWGCTGDGAQRMDSYLPASALGQPGFSDSWREVVPPLWRLVIAVLAVMVRLLPG